MNRNRRDLTRRFRPKHFFLPYGTLPKSSLFFIASFISMNVENFYAVAPPQLEPEPAVQA